MNKGKVGIWEQVGCHVAQGEGESGEQVWSPSPSGPHLLSYVCLTLVDLLLVCLIILF